MTGLILAINQSINGFWCTLQREASDRAHPPQCMCNVQYMCMWMAFTRPRDRLFAQPNNLSWHGRSVYQHVSRAHRQLEPVTCTYISLTRWQAVGERWHQLRISRMPWRQWFTGYTSPAPRGMGHSFIHLRDVHILCTYTVRIISILGQMTLHISKVSPTQASRSRDY